MLVRAAGRVLPADHLAAMVVAYEAETLPRIREALVPLAGRRLSDPI